MKIETIEIAGLAGALAALRLPYGKEVRSKIKTTLPDPDLWNVFGLVSYGADLDVDDRDERLLQTLIKRGDEHAKVVRGIMVWAKITAPIYMLREIETYRFGRERLASESTMHIDCQGLSGEELVKAKAEISMGKEQTTVDVYSYQTLRRIVIQRTNHRLPEWKEFIDWVHTLPFADELIFVGLNCEEDEQVQNKD